MNDHDNDYRLDLSMRYTGLHRIQLAHTELLKDRRSAVAEYIMRCSEETIEVVTLTILASDGEALTAD
jgi:hypothetical protein